MNPALRKHDEIAADTTSNHVYVRSKTLAWVPARLVDVRANEAVVQVPRHRDERSIVCDGGRSAVRGWERMIVKLADYPNEALPLQNVCEEGMLKEVQDMVDLPFLHEVRNATRLSLVGTLAMHYSLTTSPLHS